MFFPITRENKRISIRSPSVFQLSSPLGKCLPSAVAGEMLVGCLLTGARVSRKCLYLVPPNWGSAQQMEGIVYIPLPSDEDLPAAADPQTCWCTVPRHRPPAARVAAGCPEQGLCFGGPSRAGRSFHRVNICPRVVLSAHEQNGTLYPRTDSLAQLASVALERRVRGAVASGVLSGVHSSQCGQVTSPEP